MLVRRQKIRISLPQKPGKKRKKILAHNGFKGKVEVKCIKKVILDSASIYVFYTYSEETYDNQTISLDDKISFQLDWTVVREEYKTLDLSVYYL